MEKNEKTMNVHERICAVIAEMPGIGKGGRLQGSNGYAFRGIEQMTAALQPLFGKHGLHFVPNVLQFELVDLIVNGKPWQEARLLVAYRAYGADGDYVDIGPTLGIGRDNSDKGANKAMTAAFKYALLQTFGVSDRADDGDAERVEHAEHAEPAADLPESVATFLADMQGVSDAVRDHCRKYVKAQKFPALPSKWDEAIVTAMRAELEAALVMEAEALAAEAADMEPESVETVEAAAEVVEVPE